MKIQKTHVRIVLSAAILVLGGTAARAATTVNLGTAANYIILSETGVSTTAGTKVVGNIGVSPIAGTAITGFGLTQTKPTYATSSMVTGKVFAASYAAPTPAHLTTAIGDMTRAYDSAAARKNPNHSELGAGNIGGMTLKPGLYKWSSSVTIPSNVTLSGSQYGIWIFQIAGTLNMSAGKKVILTGGALDKNIVWQVAGAATLGTTAVLHGTVLDKTGMVLKTGAVLHGRAFAQTAITLDSNSIAQ